MLRLIVLSIAVLSACAQNIPCASVDTCPQRACQTVSCTGARCTYTPIPGCCVANGDCPDSLTNPCDIPTCTNQVCGFVKDPDCCTTNADCAANGVCERQCETNPLAADFGHCIQVNADCCNVATDCIAPDVGAPLCLAGFTCELNTCVMQLEAGCCETAADCCKNPGDCPCGAESVTCPQVGELANHCVAAGDCCFPKWDTGIGDTCNEDNFDACALITGCGVDGHCIVQAEEGCCTSQAQCDALACASTCVLTPGDINLNHCIINTPVDAACQCNSIDDCIPNECQDDAVECTALHQCVFAPFPDPTCCVGIDASTCVRTECDNLAASPMTCVDNHCTPAPGCCTDVAEHCPEPAVGFEASCDAQGFCRETAIPNFCLTAAACPVAPPCFTRTCIGNRCGTAPIPDCQTCTATADCTQVACRDTVCDTLAGICVRGPLNDASAPTGFVAVVPAGPVTETGQFISVSIDRSAIADQCPGTPTCTITNIVAADTNIKGAGNQAGNARLGDNCANNNNNLFRITSATTANICAQANRAAGRTYTFTTRCVDANNNRATFTSVLTIANRAQANEGAEGAGAESAGAGSSSLSVGSIGAIAGVAVLVVVLAIVAAAARLRRQAPRAAEAASPVPSEIIAHESTV